MVPRSGSRVLLAPRSILFAAIVCSLWWISGFPRQYDDEELHPSQRHKTESLEPFHLEFDQLIVSAKTTAPEAWLELPTLLLLTDPMYYDSMLFMGDLQMNIGAFRVEDVLDRYDESFVAQNDELERYHRQLDFAFRSVDFAKLKAEDNFKEKEIHAKLNKYKILRMIQRAWELRPERPWYAFIDADTYLVRPNLLSWLGQYNSEELIYFANTPKTQLPDADAVGGSMFILSVATMRAIMVEHPGIIPFYDARLADHKSAFEVLATILSSTINLSPNQTWPGISGFNPATLPFGPGIWCEPVLAMHSVPADLSSEIWRLERDRTEYQHLKEPLRFADLWFRFLQSENLDEPRDDWDNFSSAPGYGHWNILFEGTETTGHQHRHGKARKGEASWEACQDSCEENENCVQWSYSSVPMPNYNENEHTKCHMSRHMVFGMQVDPQERTLGSGKVALSWKSGWRKEKFQSWAMQERCKSQQN